MTYLSAKYTMINR